VLYLAPGLAVDVFSGMVLGALAGAGGYPLTVRGKDGAYRGEGAGQRE
jgi:hypothetical protein